MRTLTATQKNRIIVATGTRCLAARCDIRERKALDVHHIKPVAMGGTDKPDNLTVLCANHHRLAPIGKVLFKAVIEVLNPQEVRRLTKALKHKTKESGGPLLGNEPILGMRLPKLRL